MPQEQPKFGPEQKEVIAEALAHLLFGYWQNIGNKTDPNSDCGLNSRGRLTDKPTS